MQNANNVVNIKKPVYKPAIIEKVEQLRILDRKRKALVKECEALKKEIINFMGSTEILYDEFGTEVVTYHGHNTDRFDSKTFKIDHPSLYNCYVKQDFSKTFLLK